MLVLFALMNAAPIANHADFSSAIVASPYTDSDTNPLHASRLLSRMVTRGHFYCGEHGDISIVV
jgi:hypothetical protein